MTKKRVLIQAGHAYPREPGFEGGTGTAGEIEYVVDIRDRLAALLRKDGRFDVTTTPGDIPNGWVGDAALYEHCDGSGNPSSHGFSAGFQDGNGQRLAAAISRRYLELGHPGGHHADNYTADLRGYYGFSRTVATFEVIWENGFLTNPAEAAWLRANIQELAQAQYEALLEIFQMTPPKEATSLSPAKIARRENLQIWIKGGRTGTVVHSRKGWARNVGVLRWMVRKKTTIHPDARIWIRWQDHWWTNSPDAAGRDGVTIFTNAGMKTLADVILDRFDR